MEETMNARGDNRNQSDGRARIGMNRFDYSVQRRSGSVSLAHLHVIRLYRNFAEDRLQNASFGVQLV